MKKFIQEYEKRHGKCLSNVITQKMGSAEKAERLNWAKIRVKGILKQKYFYLVTFIFTMLILTTNI